MPLHTRIKQRREELNMSQEELANKLGYRTRSSIAKIESGNSDIPQAKITAFAEALQVSTSFLMGIETVEKVTQILNQLSPTDQQEVINFAESKLKQK